MKLTNPKLYNAYLVPCPLNFSLKISETKVVDSLPFQVYIISKPSRVVLETSASQQIYLFPEKYDI